SFSLVAKLMDYQESVKPGRYEIKPRMTNTELVRALRSARQSPLNITFNNIRTKADLAGRITRNLEIDSASSYNLLTDSAYVEKVGFNAETIMGMFVPNTYGVYGNTTAPDLVDRRHKECQRFGNDDGWAEAAGLGMDPREVAVLGS